MDNKIKFRLNKSEAIELINGLQKLIDGNINNKRLGICSNIGFEMPGKDIDYHEIFNTLGYKDLVFPIGGHKEFYNRDDFWIGESGNKRVGLCKEMIKLMQETFNIKD